MPMNKTENQKLRVRTVKYPKKVPLVAVRAILKIVMSTGLSQSFFPFNFHLQPMKIRKNAPVRRSITGDNFALRIYREHEREDFRQF